MVSQWVRGVNEWDPVGDWASFFILDVVLNFNATAAKHLRIWLAQSGHRHVPLIAPFFRSVEPSREPKPSSHLRAVAARISFLGLAGFEEFEFFSGYGVWNSLASSSYRLLFVESAILMVDFYQPCVFLLFFFSPYTDVGVFLIVRWKGDLRSSSGFLKESLYLSQYFVSLLLFAAGTPIFTLLNQPCFDSVVTGLCIWKCQN